MTVFDLVEAEAIFEQLMDRACGGEEIVLNRDGRSVARLIPDAAAPVESGQRPTEAETGNNLIPDPFLDQQPDKRIGL